MKKYLAFFSLLIVASLFLTGCKSKKEDSSSNDSESQEQSQSSDNGTNSNTNDSNSDAENRDLNPGNSINPVDKGKIVETDQFRYTLLDAREDNLESVYGGGKVYLIKLEVERIGINDSSDPEAFTGLSILEVGLTTDPTGKDSTKSFTVDFYYSRSAVGVALGEEVSELKMNEKVVGYYIYSAEKPEDQSEIYFIMKNFSADSVSNGTLGKVMGNFRIK